MEVGNVTQSRLLYLEYSFVSHLISDEARCQGIRVEQKGHVSVGDDQKQLGTSPLSSSAGRRDTMRRYTKTYTTARSLENERRVNKRFIGD